MNQALKSVVKSMESDVDEFSMIQSLCTHAVNDSVTNSKTGKWAEFQKLLVKVSLSCEDMLLTCEYGGISFSCMDIFVTVMTDEGLCCTFNTQIVHNRKIIAHKNLTFAFYFIFYILLQTTKYRFDFDFVKINSFTQRRTRWICK